MGTVQKRNESDQSVIDSYDKELDNLIDENSEFRIVGRTNTRILVDKGSPDFGWVRLRVQRKYLEVHKCRSENKKVKSVSLARHILSLTDKSLVVDHINRNTLDNRLCNLRICTQSCNMGNKKRHATASSYKGLETENRTGRVLGFAIQKDGHRETYKFTNDLISKIGAVFYDCLAISRFGEYSLINFDKEKYTPEVIDLLMGLIDGSGTLRQIDLSMKNKKQKALS